MLLHCCMLRGGGGGGVGGGGAGSVHATACAVCRTMHEKIMYIEALRRGFTAAGRTCTVSNMNKLEANPKAMPQVCGGGTCAGQVWRPTQRPCHTCVGGVHMCVRPREGGGVGRPCRRCVFGTCVRCVRCVSGGVEPEGACHDRILSFLLPNPLPSPPRPPPTHVCRRALCWSWAT